ncbi:uncharacterized protein LOC134197523 [Corticium candelabrum]|uniref:uncharacterized protein LOC134197523 n=1 Tax=Corticium candelabrum TaxID=121492 RepID=UPI002E25DF18|nr:uncharacterized protein LOC134197523 [Corticium candelabrum]
MSAVSQVDDVTSFLDKTRSAKPIERKRVLKEMCPCHVRADIPELWERIFELLKDESDIVRDQALHALGDGSPRHLEERVVKAVEEMYNDPASNVRKKARKMLTAYRKTGKWNVL